MTGPTLTMPTTFESSPVFNRSHSSPSIPDLVGFDCTSANPRESELPRSASFHILPNLNGDVTSMEMNPPSANLPTGPNEEGKLLKKQEGNLTIKSTKDERPKLGRIGRTKSLVARPKSWIQKVTGSPERRSALDSNNISATGIPPVPAIPQTSRDTKTKTVSGSFANFARKSWITSSRSSSPVRINGKDTDKKHAGELSVASPLSKKQVEPLIEKMPSRLPESPPKPDPRKISTIQKMKARPQSVFMSLNFTSTNSSTSSLPRSSMDNKSTPRTSTDRVPTVPKITEKVQNLGGESRRRDELWSAFRTLDNEYTKFKTKTWSLKTNVVRSALLPFLKTHASHSSVKALRPEDLDRRITILHKWWSGLIEVLDGTQNQTVSGVDRPVLLDACYAIMTRPEWRLAPSQFAPLSERSQSPTRILPKSQSTGSLNSSSSQFLAESVLHNTRNLFLQNLLAQVSFAVDKMSLRNAPASLVIFCGKAIAYAFFFVPSIAEVLVRVWKIQPDTLRRVSDELGLPRRLSKFETDEVVSTFPAHLRSLGWSSPKAMAVYLRQNPILSILATKINWYGPWITRWCGRDSDLFFNFVKHYHILAEEFMPSDLTLEMKARAPGFVLVQAQILTVLDATIHRQPPADPLPITFDDVLAGADASAAALPLPSTNSARPMAENRLIMLLRDFISEQPSDYENARYTFAETFGKMMQASARHTSLFDHNACFVLCDFMEEALDLYVRFHNAHEMESDFIDWYFWLDVCKKVLDSRNSMSEIRLFAFVYSAWSVIGNDEYRKQVMCLDWLLTEEMFGKFFCHWCPMVRAYYMRLLCWRLCRDDGNASDLDVKIFSTASIRIKTAWSYYLFIKQSSEEANILPPSIAPCHPAPGRRLLIIRNDNQAPSTNIFLGFDGINNSSSKRHSLATLTKFEGADLSKPKLTSDSAASSPPKRRWSLMGMGKMLPSFESSSTTKRAESPTKTLDEARKETALARSRPQVSTASSSSSEAEPVTQTHKAYCFKFSLEWVQHFEKPSNLTIQKRTSKPGAARGGGSGITSSPERRLNPPRLPAAAQGFLSSKVPGSSNEVFPRDPASSSLITGHGKPEMESPSDRIARAKYAGRALAEWALLVAECNNFVDRRMAEGVPGLKWVEIPTLGVDGFRKFGG